MQNSPVVGLSIEALIAQVLQISESQVTDDLEYQSIMEWDSLAHVNLMLALEQAYGVAIDVDTIVQLNSVAAIRAHIWPSREAEFEKVVQKTAVHRGLSGVVFDRTRTTLIDGREGKLLYRGYSIHDLVAHSTFEETAYLLLHGELPTREELEKFDAELKSARSVPVPVFEIIRNVQNAHPTEVLRTSVSSLAAFDDERSDLSAESARQRAVRLISQVPILIAAHHAIRCGKQPVQPSLTLSHAANFLYMLLGEVPTEQSARIIDRILILHADHGSNASAFTARVVAGTRSDMYATMTAAISAFAGALHGGAIENVMPMVQEIGEPKRAAEYVERLRANNEPVMGFGHRVYQKEDPRARHLRQAAQEISVELNEPKWYNILEAIVDAMRPYMDKGVDVNVDFYASIIYHMLNVPHDLFVTAFVVGRMPGWITQVQEQYANNILIRPLMQYVGDTDIPYTPIEERIKH